MKHTIGQADRQFLDELHRLGPAMVQEVCTAIGVTATAVRQRLTRLQAMGLVNREMVRSGRGRPSYRYVVTEAGLKDLGDNYVDLAQILWREIMNIEDGGVRRQVVGRIRDSLVQRYGSRVQADLIESRVNQLQAALSDRGFDVETDHSEGLPILRENNCPYHELASTDSMICEMEQEVFEEVLGTISQIDSVLFGRPQLLRVSGGLTTHADQWNRSLRVIEYLAKNVCRTCILV